MRSCAVRCCLLAFSTRFFMMPCSNQSFINRFLRHFLGYISSLLFEPWLPLFLCNRWIRLLTYKAYHLCNQTVRGIITLTLTITLNQAKVELIVFSALKLDVNLNKIRSRSSGRAPEIKYVCAVLTDDEDQRNCAAMRFHATPPSQGGHYHGAGFMSRVLLGRDLRSTRRWRG